MTTPAPPDALPAPAPTAPPPAPIPAPPLPPDTVPPVKKRLIERVLNAIETGSADGDYGDVTILHDGPGNIRQITYGRSQTTETGNLRDLIVLYSQASGAYSSSFKTYVDGLGDNELGKAHLVDDKRLLDLLRSAGKDQVMRDCQDRFFDKHYWAPAENFFRQGQFTTPLSMLIIYDSYIQSGGILDFLRQRFPEPLPSRGGHEMQWTTEYLETRDSWLRNHFRPAVRTSAYRTACYKGILEHNDWNLDLLPINAHGTPVS